MQKESIYLLLSCKCQKEAERGMKERGSKQVRGEVSKGRKDFFFFNHCNLKYLEFSQMYELLIIVRLQ